jgi:hypothetical protein
MLMILVLGYIQIVRRVVLTIGIGIMKTICVVVLLYFHIGKEYLYV